MFQISRKSDDLCDRKTHLFHFGYDFRQFQHREHQYSVVNTPTNSRRKIQINFQVRSVDRMINLESRLTLLASQHLPFSNIRPVVSLSSRQKLCMRYNTFPPHYVHRPGRSKSHQRISQIHAIQSPLLMVTSQHIQTTNDIISNRRESTV